VRTLFIVQLVVAALMAFQGLLVVARPYALLDVILTPEQLRDKSAVESTLALLKKATWYDGACWLVLAGFLGGLAIIGLRLCNTRSSRQPAPNQ
jgi:hypothetical protein